MSGQIEDRTRDLPGTNNSRLQVARGLDWDIRSRTRHSRRFYLLFAIRPEQTPHTRETNDLHVRTTLHSH